MEVGEEEVKLNEPHKKVQWLNKHRFSAPRHTTKLYSFIEIKPANIYRHT